MQMIMSQRTSVIASRLVVGFDLLLDVVHHCYGSNQNDGRNDLVRVKTGVEETPGDADCSEGLHHFEVASRGRTSEMQSFKIEKKWDPA